MSPFHALKILVRTALKQSNINLAVGGFDISINEHETGAFTPHWKPHAWIFVPESELLFGNQQLRAHFPSNKTTVPSPFKAYPWNGNLAAIAYALKGSFQRRVTLAAKTNPIGSKKRRNVRYRDLRARQKLELLIALDRGGLQCRVFLHGAKLVEEDGRVNVNRA